jgi:hypothetical protein
MTWEFKKIRIKKGRVIGRLMRKLNALKISIILFTFKIWLQNQTDLWNLMEIMKKRVSKGIQPDIHRAPRPRCTSFSCVSTSSKDGYGIAPGCDHYKASNRSPLHLHRPRILR